MLAPGEKGRNLSYENPSGEMTASKILSMRQMEANASEGGLKIKACVCAPPVYMHLCTGLFYGVHASCCPSHDTYNIKASGLAFDRLVAICVPLSYTRILNRYTVACLSGAILIRGATLLAPLPFFLRNSSFCRANILSHSYCYYPDILNLVCGDVTFSSIYGLIFVLFTFSLDAVFILASYMKILGTIMKLETQDRNWRSLHTCACHLCTVLVFYLPLISLAVLHRYTQDTSPILYTTMSNAYLFMTPLLNPLVYSLKSRQSDSPHKYYRRKTTELRKYRLA